MLAKYRALRQDHAAVSAAGRDPFGVSFDTVLSATEAVLDGRRVLLLGTNNYLGLTFDPDCVAAVGAVGDARAGGAGAFGLGRRHGGGHAVGVEGQAEVVVGAEQ